MNILIKTKLLQHLSKRDRHQGFTIVELFIVIIILGILAAIALPSFLSCGGSKGGNSEAKTYLGAINRAQQAHYMEYNKFASKIQELEIGIPTQTEKFKYLMRATDKAVFSYAIAQNDKYKSYISAVFLKEKLSSKSKNQDQLETTGILCESIAVGDRYLPYPSYQKGKPVCAVNTKTIRTF